MFWKAKSPLTASDEEWQIECWRWLLENFGGRETLSQTPLIQPTKEFFPLAIPPGEPRIRYLFEQTAYYMNLSPDAFVLIPQEEAINPIVGHMAIVQNVPSSPAGTFSSTDEGKLYITYDPALADRPVDLVSTLAHELCHSLLLRTEEKPPGGDECEEFATDLAVTFFGFGVFGANSAFEFQQYRDDAAGVQGWSTRRAGYLTEPEWGFSLAIFALATGIADDEVQRNLDIGPATYFRKAMKYLRANMSVFEQAMRG